MAFQEHQALVAHPAAEAAVLYGLLEAILEGAGEDYAAAVAEETAVGPLLEVLGLQFFAVEQLE